MYLKHPANESSEDEEGTEDTENDDDEKKEAESFQSFLEKHKMSQDKKNASQQSTNDKIP
jgi:hypothetical protein